MNDPRKQPIFPRGNGGTAAAKPPAPAKPAAPAPKQEFRSDPLLRQWCEQGTRVLVRFLDGGELTGKILQVEQFSLSFLGETGSIHVAKGAMAWVRPIVENPAV